MNFCGLGTLDLNGSKFESQVGYSKFAKVKLSKKSLLPVLTATINMWGVDEEDRKKEKVYAEIKEGKDALVFYAKSSDLGMKNVYGYPSIRFGNPPYGVTTNFNLGKVGEYKEINFSVKWDAELKGHGNFVFDIWLTKKGEGPLKDDIEVMIWLSYTDKVPWDKIGDVGSIEIKYKKKEENWNNGGHVFAFALPQKKGDVKFDLINLLSFCKKKIKNIADYYIRAIELGTEFSKNSEMKIKLNKLDINFKK